ELASPPSKDASASSNAAATAFDATASTPGEIPPVTIDGGAREPEGATPAPLNVSTSEVEGGASATPPTVEAAASAPSDSPPELPGAGDIDVDTTDGHFSAQETPWPELSQQGAAIHPATPVPGAIPTDAMGGDSDAAR